MESSAFRHVQESAGGKPIVNDRSIPKTYRFCHPTILHFGDSRQEYDAAHTDAALFDVSDRTQIELTGKDAQPFVHNFCTNDIKLLGQGEGCEAFVANIKGRILAHIFVFVADDSVWIESTPNAEETLLAHFDRYLIREDVQLHARTEQTGELFITGPESSDKLASLDIGSDTAGLFHHTVVRCGEFQITLRRVDLFGQPGFLLGVDRTKLASLWKELIDCGVRPGGAEAFHALRIESCFPLHGLDLSDDNLAPEAARSNQAISFTKGCYLGQEPIARIDAIGHVNRELRRLTLDSETVAEPGDVVGADDSDNIGVITSSARIPGQGSSVALGILRSKYLAPGTAVWVSAGDSKIPAKVESLLPSVHSSR